MDGEEEDEDEGAEDEDNDSEDPAMASPLQTSSKTTPSDGEFSASTSFSLPSSPSSASLYHTCHGDQIPIVIVSNARKLPSLASSPLPTPPPVSRSDSVATKRRCMAADCTVSLMADCAAVCCCCPLCFLQLALFAFVKLPSAAVTRAIAAAKRKRNKMKRKRKTKTKMTAEKKCNTSSNGSHDAGASDDSLGWGRSSRRSPIALKGQLSPAQEIDHQQLQAHFRLSHSAGFGIPQQESSD